MPHVRILPDQVAAELPAEGTLLEGLLAAGVPIAHACGGNARCSTCRVRVVDGVEHLGPRPEDECAIATRLGFDDATRLACRARLAGDVSVRRLVVDERDVALASRAARTPSEGAVGREEFLSVLFVDVADFTPLSEELPPYDVVHLLNRWFDLAGEAITAHGGRIDNYMGDGLLAVFGRSVEGPEPGPDGAPQRAAPSRAAAAAGAVRAGLALLRAAEDTDRYARPLYGRPFRVRVGIHCGDIVTGPLGAAGQRRETVIGDPVNAAARIEAANKPAGTSLLVSEDVAALLRTLPAPGPQFGKTVTAALKGKSGDHVLREVLHL
jgi:adenylate cyclase